MNWDLSKLYSGFTDEKLLSDTADAFEKLAALRKAIAALPGNDPAAGLTEIVLQLQAAAELQIKIGNFTFLTERPLHMETAKASIERATAITNTSKMPKLSSSCEKNRLSKQYSILKTKSQYSRK